MQHALDRLPENRTLEDQTYAQIRQALSSGALKPGQRLSAGPLAKELGVSRMPVVQALRRLVSEGFLSSEARKSMRVVDPSPDQVRERYLLISALERLCVNEVFARQAAGIADQMDETLTRERSLQPDERLPQGNENLDFQFHAALWDGSGLPAVGSLLKTLWDQGGLYRSLLLTRDEFRDVRLSEHGAIVQAMRSGDPDAAITALAEHRVNGMRRMLSIVPELSDRDLSEPGGA